MFLILRNGNICLLQMLMTDLIYNGICRMCHQPWEAPNATVAKYWYEEACGACLMLEKWTSMRILVKSFTDEEWEQVNARPSR